MVLEYSVYVQTTAARSRSTDFTTGVFSFNFKVGTGEGLDDEPGSFDGGSGYQACYRRGEMEAMLHRAGLRVFVLESYPGKIFGEEIVQVWTQKP